MMKTKKMLCAVVMVMMLAIMFTVRERRGFALKSSTFASHNE